MKISEKKKNMLFILILLVSEGFTNCDFVVIKILITASEQILSTECNFNYVLQDVQ